MTIQAIQTKYRGITFRSRLEARWAVFFDALRVSYRYEPEGYRLPSGPYLPDFFLPDQDCFVEIKGPYPTLEESALAGELCEGTKKNTYVFFGNVEKPSSGESAHCYRIIPESETAVFDLGYHWCECPHCGCLGIQFEGRADRLRCQCPRSTHGDRGHNYDSLRLVRAYEAARAERFGT